MKDGFDSGKKVMLHRENNKKWHREGRWDLSSHDNN